MSRACSRLVVHHLPPAPVRAGGESVILKRGERKVRVSSGREQLTKTTRNTGGLLPAPRTSVATALFGRPDGMRPPVVARDHSPCAGPSQKGVGIGQRGASGCPGGGQRPHQLRFLFHDVRRATLGHHMGAHSKVTHAVDPSPDAASSRAGLALSSDNGRSTAAPERPLAELQLHATGLAPDAEQTPSCTQPDAVVLLKPSDLVTAVQPPQGMLQNENEGQTTRSSSVVSASSLAGQAGTPPSLPSHNPGSAEPARRGNTLSVERSPLCQLSAFPNADSHSGSSSPTNLISHDNETSQFPPLDVIFNLSQVTNLVDLSAPIPQGTERLELKEQAFTYYRLIPSARGTPKLLPNFEKADSKNLPDVDMLMLAHYLGTKGSMWSPELRLLKAARQARQLN
ncbi:Hypothetical predicted protein [Cloeon dipterum]|uniref:Uncharacterized protein n=1 Tax=Cloeon dipterum TaxID=197152 RepID=A0A8S1E4F9_9INSE|nr:Hypothetical predicted protein [Cloeon dipterum]